MFNAMNAQSEFARRHEFVSQGMQDAQVFSQFISNLVRRSRDRLLKDVSDRRASPAQQIPIPSQQLHSINS